MSNDPYTAQEFTISEIQAAINTLSQVFNELEFTRGGRGMAFIAMWLVFQHRIAGHDWDLLLEQLKGIWGMLDQIERGLPDSKLSKNN